MFLKLLGLAKLLRLNSLCVRDTSRLISVAENATSCSVPYTRSLKSEPMFLHSCSVPEATISRGVPDTSRPYSVHVAKKELVNNEFEDFVC